MPMPPAHPAAPARVAWVLMVATVGLVALGLSAGGDGWSFAWREDAALIGAIRAPRTLGAFCAGALLALAGAVAQGLFRNPLADPYLLGSAAGANLAVVAVIVLASVLGPAVAGATAATGAGASPVADADVAGRIGMMSLGFAAAFAGALAGVLLTVSLAGGGARPTLMLLCGVVVAVLLNALSDLLLVFFPQALRGRQIFSLGTTGFVGWPACGLMAVTLAVVLPLALKAARVLDALVLGEATAASLGLPLRQLRLALVALMALATGCAVAQVGLVAFVGLVAPHLVRRRLVLSHAPLLLLSTLTGGVLLLAADVLARVLIAPRELPVGLLTAVIGGLYLLVLLRRRSEAR